MGQTLTHGIYLPDEGERNCYNGLAGNWTILDGAVGTIAEHTSALAGKAPLVHTHTKADITDFPAYGNTAGTICEGNDSRLSDARTPVAHTHGKADVTDLFNSANTWIGSQQFNVSVKFSGQTGINWARGGTTGTLPSSVLYYGFQNALDSNDNTFDRIRSYVSTTGTNLQEHIKYAWNDLTKYATINFWINADGSDSEYKLSVKRVIPGSSNETDLGDSTHKWKTLNGINPGALSLPSSDSADYIDLSDYLSTNAEYIYTAPYDGWLCLYVTVNEFYTENAVGLFRSDTSANSHQWAKSVTAALNMYKQNKYQGSVMLPVESGKKYICYISLNANTTVNRKQLFFYKNKGNA